MEKEILDLRERNGGICTYSSNYTNGALRLVSVERLLQPNDSSIVLLEFGSDNGVDSVVPKYASISHVWEPSSEVASISASNARPLVIDIGYGEHHTISWVGLIQAATAAAYLNCDYLWVDLLCLNQRSPTDKAMQIKNMGNIYKNSSSVLVMPGGIAAVQSAESAASWITRAWTFQEATLCSNTYVLFLWPLAEGTYLRASRGTTNLDLYPLDGGLAIATLFQLIGARQRRFELCVSSTADGDGIWRAFDVQCFGNQQGVIRALEGALLAMGRNLSSQWTLGQRRSEGGTAVNLPMLHAATWRSMWVRTSSKPQDMVFSVMHLLGAEIEVDYSRSREDLILELVSKTFHLPLWIDIGDRLPIDPGSGLLPLLPTFHPHATPSLQIDQEMVPVARLVNDAVNINKFDIVLKPDPDFNHPVICGQILKIALNNGKYSVSNSTKSFNLVTYSGRMGSHAIVVGEMEAYNLPRDSAWSFSGSRVFLIDCDEGGWQKCGQGYLSGFIGRGKRKHIKLGSKNWKNIESCKDTNRACEAAPGEQLEF